MYAEVAAPPYQFTFLHGVPENALADSLIDSEDGIRSSGDGEDLQQDLANRTAVDKIGRSIRFAQRDDTIGFGTSTPMVKAWADGAETLADNDALAALAKALDDEDVISAVLSQSVGGGLEGYVGSTLAPEALEQLEKSLEGMIPDDPYDAVGIGWDADGDVHVAYHFGDADAAEASVDVLEKVWSEGTSVRTMRPLSDLVTLDEVDAEGEVVVVGIRPVDQRAGVPWQMLMQREVVFISR
ncbi:hypothetical protein [Nocardioides alcanivorans]|uniref:hypothetical protein n=1 Tax=Nocardioides alcanivorans TaxID=2897352 RepID=UPI001F2B8CC9|nr:hypothetical protein [Nocardioides alcanivorans]